MYCVYLTVYRGNKLPPFYIGSSSVDKINNGYCGSVSSKKYRNIWKQELKDNPQLFKSKIISIHNARQEALNKEYKLQKQLNVVKNVMYINQALASKDGYFGRNVSGLNHPNFGNQLSNEHKLKISKANVGKFYKFRKSPNKNTRRKLSDANLGSKNPMYGKIGKNNPRFGQKHSKETKKKMSDAWKRRKLHSVSPS